MTETQLRQRYGRAYIEKKSVEAKQRNVGYELGADVDGDENLPPSPMSATLHGDCSDQAAGGPNGGGTVAGRHNIREIKDLERDDSRHMTQHQKADTTTAEELG